MTRSCPGFVGNCPVAWKWPAEGAEAPAPWGRGTRALGLGVLWLRCVYALRTLHLVLFNTADVTAVLHPVPALGGVKENLSLAHPSAVGLCRGSTQGSPPVLCCGLTWLPCLFPGLEAVVCAPVMLRYPRLQK